MNCVGLKAFNTNVFVRIETSSFKPADGRAKECSTSIPGGAIERNANDVTGSD